VSGCQLDAHSSLLKPPRSSQPEPALTAKISGRYAVVRPLGLFEDVENAAIGRKR